MPPSITNSTIVNHPPTAGSGTQVTWPTVFWALLPIMFNSMTQPAGTLAYEISAEQSFYLRASPVLCIVDALVVLVQFVKLSIKTRSPRLAITAVSRSKKTERSAEPETTRTQLRNLQENDVFRTILFLFGVLPSVIRLYACTGIPGSQALASLYLISWTILEILVVLPARHGISYHSDGIVPTRARVRNVDELMAYLCYVAIHFSDFMAFYVVHVAIHRVPPSRQPPPHWSDHLQLTLVEMGYILFLLPRVAPDDNPQSGDRTGVQVMEWCGYVGLLFVVAAVRGDTRVVEIVWLASLRIGRLISAFGLNGPRVRDGAIYVLPFANSPRQASVAFFLTQVVTAVGYLYLKYDSAGTSKPAWTHIFG
ncbi:MAG: hypothetical protein LQ346_006428 [Caloplaca aetnensis]|nr:MAG: hypothetical protein LQ346_006428 [Caloplaca aetnensis]